MSGRNKEVKALVAAAGEQGWDVEIDGAGHYRLTPPSGGIGVSISATPSDWRTLKNETARLKRMGLRLSDDEDNEACLASWHIEDDAPGRFCPRCKGTRKVALGEELPESEEEEEFVVPAQWLQPPETSESADARPIRQQVLATLQDLQGEFVTSAEVAALTGVPRGQVGTALRTLLGTHGVERSKRGRYGIRVPQIQTSIQLTERVGLQGEPDAKEEVAMAVAETQAPEHVTVELVEQKPKLLFEATGLKDHKGRDVIQSDSGELFVAIPLVLGS